MNATVVDITIYHEAQALHASGPEAIASQIGLNREISAAREEEIRRLERALALSEHANADMRNKAQALLSRTDILHRENGKLLAEVTKKSRRLGELEVLLEFDATKTIALLENRKDWQRAINDPQEAIVTLALGDASTEIKVGTEVSLDQAMSDGFTCSLASFFARVLSGHEIQFFPPEEVDPALYHDPHIDK